MINLPSSYFFTLFACSFLCFEVNDSSFDSLTSLSYFSLIAIGILFSIILIKSSNIFKGDFLVNSDIAFLAADIATLSALSNAFIKSKSSFLYCFFACSNFAFDHTPSIPPAIFNDSIMSVTFLSVSNVLFLSELDTFCKAPIVYPTAGSFFPKAEPDQKLFNEISPDFILSFNLYNSFVNICILPLVKNPELLSSYIANSIGT